MRAHGGSRKPIMCRWSSADVTEASLWFPTRPHTSQSVITILGTFSAIAFTISRQAGQEIMPGRGEAKLGIMLTQMLAPALFQWPAQVRADGLWQLIAAAVLGHMSNDWSGVKGQSVRRALCEWCGAWMRWRGLYAFSSRVTKGEEASNMCERGLHKCEGWAGLVVPCAVLVWTSASRPDAAFEWLYQVSCLRPCSASRWLEGCSVQLGSGFDRTGRSASGVMSHGNRAATLLTLDASTPAGAARPCHPRPATLRRARWLLLANAPLTHAWQRA
jgi:hypothetical protein